jgi:hypothetical protein
MSATLTRVRTFGTLILEARTMLQDKMPTSGGALRYTDDEMFESINGAMAEARAKRPDLFLRAFGPTSLRNPIFPYYSAAHDMNTPFPLDLQAYQAFLYYCAGRQELREDTFSDDSRAVTLMNKFVSQLLSVSS